MKQEKKYENLEDKIDMISIALFSISIFMFIVMMTISLSIDVMPSDIPYVVLAGKLLIYLSGIIQIVPMIIEKKHMQALVLALIIGAWILLFEVL
ncbi:hypothetical protein HYE69_05425 [Staphylococcus sp. GSSP0090]|nr:hypothetical protein [Staphylococcus sp. GSSP0090]